MKTGRCLTSQYGSLGCSLDLLADLDFACSGQPFCSLGVRELIHHNPCPRELRGYLEAQYTCIKGETIVSETLYEMDYIDVLCHKVGIYFDFEYLICFRSLYYRLQAVIQ